MSGRHSWWLVGFVVVVGLAVGCGKDESPAPAQNTAPTASFTVIPKSGTTATVFQFDASGCTDAEDPVAALQIRWDWESDGTWDTQYSATETGSWQFATAGSKTIKLEVKDTGALTGTTTRQVVVTGEGPITPAMVLVPAGDFTMGDGVSNCGADQHQVTLTHSVYLGRYETTIQEYRNALQWAYNRGYVTATTDSVNDNLDGSTTLLVDFTGGQCGDCVGIAFSGGTFTIVSGMEDHPMWMVTWFGAAAYCDWLNMGDGIERVYNHSTWRCNGGDPYGAHGYRLPTDAEWEHAARYDDERIYPWGNEDPDCARANFSDNEDCVGSTSPVGSYPAAPASLGLFDMAGNVWEWCNDWDACDL